MKYLVTGGCGFIGHYTVQELVKQGHEVTVLDNIVDQRPQINGVTYHAVDISNYNQIYSYFEGIDRVIHLAAISNTKVCIDNPRLANQVNVTGTLNVLEASRQNGVKRVVCASSHVVLAGMHPLRMTKITVENYCHMYMELYEQSVICLRYAAIYGKGQTAGNVLNAFQRAKAKHGQITIFGDGLQERDFLHVSDCVRANLIASEATVTGVMDICTGQMYNLNHIAKLFQCPIVYRETREGDAATFDQSPEQAKELLNFTSTIDLDTGIKDYL